MAAIAGRRIVNGDVTQKPYILSVAPVNYSLTDGTSIPAPSPPRTPAEPRKPIAGPLSSHPPSTASTTATSKLNDAALDNGKSFHPSPVPVSQGMTASSESPRPHGMRRLLSLNNLRSSFSSSRTSLLLFSRNSQDPYSMDGGNRPTSSGTTSILAPSMVGTTEAPPTRRRRRSSLSWFNRRSGLGQPNGDANYGYDEHGRQIKRRKEYRPPPTLPEISELAGGNIDSGNLDWDDGMFSK